MTTIAESRLLRWLVPGSQRLPPDVGRRTQSLLPDRPPGVGDAQRYYPQDRPAIGSYLLLHGINPWGPRDPRFERFAAVLAHAGFLVLTPDMPQFTALMLDPAASEVAALALEHLRGLPERPRNARPAVMSISFGSLPALTLASRKATAESIAGVLTFGGYGDPLGTLRFVLGLRSDLGLASDPLSLPAVAMNFVDQCESRPAEVESLKRSWRCFAEATWGRPEMRAPQLYRPVAQRLAAELAPAQRRLFLSGCGLTEDAIDLWERALTRRGPLTDLDPRPLLSGIRSPVHLMHGVNDDVVPVEQAQVLRRALPPSALAGFHITGLYDHSNRTHLSLTRLGPLARDLATFRGMARAVVQVGCDRGPRASR